VVSGQWSEAWIMNPYFRTWDSGVKNIRNAQNLLDESVDASISTINEVSNGT